jgi:hypothetical protein
LLDEDLKYNLYYSLTLYAIRRTTTLDLDFGFLIFSFIPQGTHMKLVGSGGAKCRVSIIEGP